METIEITKAQKQLIATESILENARFNMVCLNRAQFIDIAATNIKISDANLSDLEIDGAQLGGTYII